MFEFSSLDLLPLYKPTLAFSRKSSLTLNPQHSWALCYDSALAAFVPSINKIRFG
jgi:hypothetical protein